jgi:hypothetical protein
MLFVKCKSYSPYPLRFFAGIQGREKIKSEPVWKTGASGKMKVDTHKSVGVYFFHGIMIL